MSEPDRSASALPKSPSDDPAEARTDAAPWPLADERADRGRVQLSAAAQRALQLLLRLDPSSVAEIRRASSGRWRPRRQAGPSADYGTDSR